MKRLLCVVLLFMSCSSSGTKESFRLDNFNIGESAKQTVTVLKPVKVDIAGKGLYSAMNHKEKKAYLDVIVDGGESVFKEMIFHKNLLSKVERNNILFALDKDESFQRVVSLDRKLQQDVGYVLTEDETKVLTDFSKESKVGLVILPVDITLAKNVVDKGRETVEVDLLLTLEYQFWDIEKGAMVYESVVSDSKSYFIKKEQMNSTKELEKLVKKTYKSLIVKVKHGDRG